MNRRAILLGVGALLGGIGGYVLWGRRRLIDMPTIQARAEATGARYGIHIGYGPPDTFFVPPYTVADARIEGAAATQVELTALPPALDGIEQSLHIYPPGFFARFCKAIFLCGSLTLDGVQAGGTYGQAWILLVATERIGEAGIFETARLGVHHEFSSLIWNRMPALPLRWASLLPPGWQPVRDNAQALQAPDHGSMRFSNGFLSPYGATTAENDFNVYAETIFTNPRRIVELAREHDIVASKAVVLMAAYAELDERLSTVFQSLGLAQLRNVMPDRLEGGISLSPTATPRGEIVPR